MLYSRNRNYRANQDLMELTQYFGVGTNKKGGDKGVLERAAPPGFMADIVVGPVADASNLRPVSRKSGSCGYVFER
ncbi:MAG: hypothetical protein MUO43_17470 [Desulfobacterales bacterium]|nr:hypothetical protein [Desulfobacterales bacterium]